MDNLAVCVQNDNDNVTPKETIDAIYQSGFKNVFVQYYHRNNLEFDEIKQIDYCRELGLNIIFCHLGYSNINEIWIDGEKGDIVTDEYIADLDLMHEKQINMVCMHLTTHKEAPMYNEIGLDRIKKIVKHAEKLGIKIGFENTRKRGFLEYVLGNIESDNIGLCFDIGHYHVYFNDELDFSLFKDRIFGVHLHDNDGNSDQHLLPFDGNIDWENGINLLKQNGYNGPVTLEVCYYSKYLKKSVDDFYKIAYKRAKQVSSLF